MNTKQQDEKFIREVNEIALQAAESGFAPFDAILIKEGKVVSTSMDWLCFGRY